MLGGTVAAPGQPLGTATTVQPGASVPQRVTGTSATPTAFTSVRALTLNVCSLLSVGGRVPSFPFTLMGVFFYFGEPLMSFCTSCLQETLENVKKCRSFLSTLIKLTSNGKQSSETTANVKELIKKLLVGLQARRHASPSYGAPPCFGLMFPFLLCDDPSTGSKDRSRGLHQQVVPGAQLLATAVPCAFLKGEICHPPTHLRVIVLPQSSWRHFTSHDFLFGPVSPPKCL